MSQCIDCSLPLRPRQEVVSCTQCNQQQHRTCHTNITRDQYRQAVKDKRSLGFVCNPCLQTSSDATIPYMLQDDATIPYETSNIQLDDSSFDLCRRQTIDIPEQLVKNSIADDDLDPFPTTETEVTFQVVDAGTERSKRKLVSSDGFTFTVKRRNLSSTEWRCSIRNKTVTCPSTVTQKGYVFTTNKDHLHAAKPRILKSVIIQKEIRLSAKADLFEPAPAIVDKLLEEHVDSREPESARNQFTNLTRNCNRIRQKARKEITTSKLLKKCARIYGPSQ